MNGDYEVIRTALFSIPAHDRDTWLRMGMAVKSELDEDGFALWDDWSRTADNYNAKDAKTVWRSIKPNGGSPLPRFSMKPRPTAFNLLVLITSPV